MEGRYNAIISRLREGEKIAELRAEFKKIRFALEQLFPEDYQRRIKHFSENDLYRKIRAILYEESSAESDITAFGISCEGNILDTLHQVFEIFVFLRNPENFYLVLRNILGREYPLPQECMEFADVKDAKNFKRREEVLRNYLIAWVRKEIAATCEGRRDDKPLKTSLQLRALCLGLGIDDMTVLEAKLENENREYLGYIKNVAEVILPEDPVSKYISSRKKGTCPNRRLEVFGVYYALQRLLNSLTVSRSSHASSKHLTRFSNNFVQQCDRLPTKFGIIDSELEMEIEIYEVLQLLEEYLKHLGKGGKKNFFNLINLDSSSQPILTGSQPNVTITTLTDGDRRLLRGYLLKNDDWSISPPEGTINLIILNIQNKQAQLSKGRKEREERLSAAQRAVATIATSTSTTSTAAAVDVQSTTTATSAKTVNAQSTTTATAAKTVNVQSTSTTSTPAAAEIKTTTTTSTASTAETVGVQSATTATAAATVGVQSTAIATTAATVGVQSVIIAPAAAAAELMNPPTCLIPESVPTYAGSQVETPTAPPSEAIEIVEVINKNDEEAATCYKKLKPAFNNPPAAFLSDADKEAVSVSASVTTQQTNGHQEQQVSEDMILIETRKTEDTISIIPNKKLVIGLVTFIIIVSLLSALGVGAISLGFGLPISAAIIAASIAAVVFFASGTTTLGFGGVATGNIRLPNLPPVVTETSSSSVSSESPKEIQDAEHVKKAEPVSHEEDNSNKSAAQQTAK